MKQLVTLSIIAALSYISVEAQVDEEVREETIETIILEEEVIELEEVEEVRETQSYETNERFERYVKPDYIVEEVENSVSVGSATGQTVYVPDVTAKFAAKEWAAFMKDYKVKRKESKESKVYNLSQGELKGIDLRIPTLSNDLLDMYATFDEKGDGIQISTHYDLGNNQFLTYGDEPNKYRIAEGMLQDFGESLTRKLIEMEVEEEQGNLKAAKKEQDALVKQNGQLHKAIEKNKEVIRKAEEAIIQAEKDIEENLVNQKEQQKAIVDQEDVLDYVKSKLRKF